MGLSSAFGALKDKAKEWYNKFDEAVDNSIIGKYGNPASMTFDTTGNHFNPPREFDADGKLVVYDPTVSSAVEAITGKGTLPASVNKPTRPVGSPSDDDSSGGSGNSGAPSASQLDYLYADLSKHYKMDASTAFQEALANTEYSRSVEDMKRAGLNPAAIFGGGSGSGSGANSNIRGRLQNAGGGSGGRRNAYYSSKGSKGYYFSSSAYSIISALGGIIGGAATKSPSGYWMGSSLAQGAMNAISAFSNWMKGK